MPAAPRRLRGRAGLALEGRGDGAAPAELGGGASRGRKAASTFAPGLEASVSAKGYRAAAPGRNLSTCPSMGSNPTSAIHPPAAPASETLSAAEGPSGVTTDTGIVAELEAKFGVEAVTPQVSSDHIATVWIPAAKVREVLGHLKSGVERPYRT